MTHLHLVEQGTTPVADHAALRHALKVLRDHPVGTQIEEALLLVEIMDARAAQMPPGDALRKMLVRLVSSLAQAHGHRHLSPLP